MKMDFVQTQWARLLMGTLQRVGVAHAVVSPGSRSTPFLASLLEHTHILVHTIIDERSAAYVGVGLARASRRPVLILCTSGTAAANYLPAVVEADESGVPLLVLTADRPVEAHFAHCPQTTDQVQLYGTHVRRYVELGEAHAQAPALRALQRLIRGSVHVALSPVPGPVHLNAQARKPLEPAPSASSEDESFAAEVTELLAHSLELPEMAPRQADARVVRKLAERCTARRQGLIVCGYDPQWPELDGNTLADFSLATGYPVWLDVAHPLRWNPPPKLAARLIGSAHLIWGAPEIEAPWVPDMVVQVGAIPTSGHWERWLDRGGAAEHVLIARHGWPDPSGRAELVLVGDPSCIIRDATDVIAATNPSVARPTAWFWACKRADQLATSALETFMAAEPPSSELLMVRTALESCPEGTRVVLGNSLPIREADLVWPAAERALHVLAIRGANGIDGVVSTAIGIALEGRAPVMLLVGDLSFIHDIGALYAARAVKSPLAIVVIDNRGGRIFEQLPIGAHKRGPELEHWTTPHSLKLEAAGELFGIDVYSPASPAELKNHVVRALASNQATLICASVEPTSSKRGTAGLRNAVSARLDHG